MNSEQRYTIVCIHRNHYVVSNVLSRIERRLGVCKNAVKLERIVAGANSRDTPAPVVSAHLTAGDWTKGLTLGVELVRNGGL